MKEHYKTIIFLFLACSFINIFCFVIFELPILHSEKIGIVQEYFGILLKIIICLITGTIFSYKKRIIFFDEDDGLRDNKQQYFFRKSCGYLYTLLIILLIYYLMPQIGWNIINFICNDLIMNNNMTNISFSLINIIKLCIGSLFNFSSILAYIICIISYFIVQYLKITKLYKRRIIGK